MIEPKVVRRNPRFSSALSSDPNGHDSFVKYIPADKWDKWAAVSIGVAVLIVVALDSAWLMGWLK